VGTIVMAASGVLYGVIVLALVASCGGGRALDSRPATPGAAVPAGDLRPPEAFASIADRDERSRALFVEASRVLFHPRCANCHPSDDSPRQRDAREAHDPPVARGDDDRGVPAMRCASCHQDENLELARVPGAGEWRLAPRSMAWMGKMPAAVCAQVKDPARNGGRSLAKLVDHAAHDPLVAWGWAPGHGRTPAPGSQERFAALVAAWVESGAGCPAEEGKP
jgi:mono/diheme cytochrome c family protein